MKTQKELEKIAENLTNWLHESLSEWVEYYTTEEANKIMDMIEIKLNKNANDSPV